MNQKITGSEILMKALAEEGVDLVFGYPGGAIMPVYDKLYDYSSQIQHILTRHEQGAIHAAEGYARVTGRPGVVIVTSGPGATNLVTGLSDAQMDSTPLVCITGQVGNALLGCDGFQETDVVGVTLPITKWATQVRRPEDIAPAVARAFYIANSGRPGPVVIDITKDAQVNTAYWHYEPCRFIRSYNPHPTPKPEDLRAAADLLQHAERPLILAGHGVTIAKAEEALIRLAEKAGIPIATTLLGLSSVPSDHPLAKGMLGMHGNIGPNVNTNRADVILAVGMRFDDRVTGDTSKYAPDAAIIHIDIDASEFNKNIRADVAIHADAKDALEALGQMVGPRSHSEWSASFRRADKVEYDRVVREQLEPASPTGKMHMGEVVRKVSEAFGNEAIMITDVGQNQMFAARYFKYTSPRSSVTSGGLGTMGFGLPAAIGAKMGRPDRDVVLFVGDGGLQMTVQELGTVMQYGTPVKIVLLNNNFLGNVRQWQALFFNRRFSQTPMLNPDFKALAAAFGVKGEDVSDRSQLDEAVKRLVESPESYIINVNIDEEDMVFPMTVAGHPVDEILLDADSLLDLDKI